MALQVFNKRARRQEMVETNSPQLIGFTGLWPSATPPAGWLVCDGSTFVSATYPELATLLGITWGTPGAGLTQLPDFMGRSLFGVGTNADVNSLANSRDGIAAASRRPSHVHGAGLTGHLHTANHGHTADSHTHTAGGSHVHTSTDHTHTTQTHGHGVSGTTGASNNNVSADGVPPTTGTETRNSVHTHGAGTLVGDANDLGTTGGFQNNANGGFTDGQTPGATGSGAPTNHVSGGESTSTDVTSSASTAATPFLVCNWIIKAAA